MSALAAVPGVHLFIDALVAARALPRGATESARPIDALPVSRTDVPTAAAVLLVLLDALGPALETTGGLASVTVANDVARIAHDRIA